MKNTKHIAEMLLSEVLKQPKNIKFINGTTFDDVLKNDPWLLKNDKNIKNAEVSYIDEGDVITFHSGTWKNGTWKRGLFYGTWDNGTFEDGEFYGDVWKNGTFENGRFFKGTWKNGTWEDGSWWDVPPKFTPKWIKGKDIYNDVHKTPPNIDGKWEEESDSPKKMTDKELIQYVLNFNKSRK